MSGDSCRCTRAHNVTRVRGTKLCFSVPSVPPFVGTLQTLYKTQVKELKEEIEDRNRQLQDLQKKVQELHSDRYGNSRGGRPDTPAQTFTQTICAHQTLARGRYFLEAGISCDLTRVRICKRCEACIEAMLTYDVPLQQGLPVKSAGSNSYQGGVRAAGPGSAGGAVL